MHRPNLYAIPVVLVLAACSASAPIDGKGGEGGGGGNSTAPIPLSEACAAISASVCEGYVACGFFGTESLSFCTEEILGCDAFPVQQQVDAGQMAYDGLALRRCVGKLENAPCSEDGWFEVFAVDADCRAAFRGLVPVNGECEDDLVCASGVCSGECPGHCRATGELGAACVPGEFFCAPHLGCVDGVCGELPVAGQRCTQDWEPEGWDGRCAPGLFCDGTGTCRAYAGQGEPCAMEDWEYAVPPVPCEMRWICVDGTCVARGAVGAPCPEGWECQFSLRCDDGTCAARIPEGGACTGGWEDYESCAAGLYCLSTGVCGRPLPAGAPCDEEFDDCAYWCEGGTCGGEVGPGEACDDETIYCWSGPCVNGVCTDDECGEW